MRKSDRRAIISGIGISRIGRKTGIPAIDLSLQSARGAIIDAGLKPSEIDGIASFGASQGELAPDHLLAALGMASERVLRLPSDKMLGDIADAAECVLAGRARHVLVYRTVKMKDGSVTAPLGEAERNAFFSQPAMKHVRELMSYGAAFASNWLAMNCQRHMFQYGTTREQLGAIALNSRSNAALNPNAVLRAPLSMDDYLGARPVSSPFGLFDCDIPVDGSVAFVVSIPEHAADCAQTPIYLESSANLYDSFGWTGRPDYPNMASVEAAAQMWNKTDLTPSQVDIAQLYDGFTFLVLAWLEALGFCKVGESGPYVEGGRRIALDGELPVNTYGGQLSAGRMHGYWVLHEACLQLRGAAGDRQVRKVQPKVAVATAGGGPIANCLLLRR